MSASQVSLPAPIESIAVREFFEDFGEQLRLRLVTKEKTLSRSTIRERSVNRPALAVTGYFKYFAHKRIQLFGAGEMAFFREQSPARRSKLLAIMASKRFPYRGFEEFGPTAEMIKILDEYEAFELRSLPRHSPPR